MKNTAIKWGIPALVFFALLGGCTNVLNTAFVPQHGQTAEGNVILSLEHTGRTLAPESIYVVFEFTPEFSDPVEDPVTGAYASAEAESGYRVDVHAGTWKLNALGYRSQAAYEDYLAAVEAAEAADPPEEVPPAHFGSYEREHIVINGETQTEVVIQFTPLLKDPDAEGLSGFFGWDIDLGEDTVEASMTLAKADGVVVPGLENINLASEAENPSPAAVELPVGSYLLTITLTNSYGQEAGLTDAVHIYSGLDTRAAYTFDSNIYTSQVYLSGTIDAAEYPDYTPIKVEAFYPGGASVAGQEFLGITAGSGEIPTTWELYLPAFGYTVPVDPDYPNGSRRFALKVYMQNDDDNGGYSREIPVTLDLIGRTDLELEVEKYTLTSEVSTGNGRGTGTLAFSAPAAFEGESIIITLASDEDSWVGESPFGTDDPYDINPISSGDQKEGDLIYALQMPNEDVHLTVTFSTPAKPVPVLSSTAPGTLKVTWDDPVEPAGYEVWYGKSASRDNAAKLEGTIPGSTREIEIDSLEKGIPYYVWVRGLGPSGEPGEFSDSATRPGRVYLSGTIINTGYSAYTPKWVEALNLNGDPVAGQENGDIPLGSNQWNISLPAFSADTSLAAGQPAGTRAYLLKVKMEDAGGSGSYSKGTVKYLNLNGQTGLELPVEKYTLGYTVNSGEDFHGTGTLTFDPPEAVEGETVTVALSPNAAMWVGEDPLTGTYGSGKPVSAFAKLNQTTYTLTMPQGDLNLTVTFNKAIPPTPILSATVIKELVVEWTATNAAGYEIWYGDSTSTDSYVKWGGEITGTTTKQTIITGLDSAKRYYVRIRGLGPSGEQGEFGDSVNAFTMLDKPVLNDPQALDYKQARISWAAVTSAVSYEIRYTANRNETSPTAAGVQSRIVTGALAVTLTESDITQPNLIYKIWVQARNSAGAVSPWSDYREVRVEKPGVNVEYNLAQENLIISPPGDITIYKVADNVTRFNSVEITVPQGDYSIAWYIDNKDVNDFSEQYPGSLMATSNMLLLLAEELPLRTLNVYIRITQGGIVFSREIPVTVQ
jgi:hypothetical protein